jgi:putative transposase
MRFALKVGLTLKDGDRVLELTRVLNDREVQFEDVSTRRVRQISISDLVKRVYTGRYQVAGGSLDAVGGIGRPEEPLDLTSLPRPLADEVERKMRYIKAVRAAHLRRGQRDRIHALITDLPSSGGKRPTASSVMKWIRDYEAAGNNAVALLPATVFKKRRRRLSDELESLIADTLRREYFTRDRHPMRHAVDCARREISRQVSDGKLDASQASVSTATLYRRSKEVDAYQRIASREGSSRARMELRSPLHGDPATYPLQRVEIDHTPLNWVVVCDRTGLPLGRPLLTVAIDSATSYPHGFYLSFYGAGVTSVCGVMRSAIGHKDDVCSGVKLAHRWLAYGLPDEVVLDNGMEFHSRAFKAMCWALRTDMTFCRVRTPWLKPHVERFFANLDWLTLTKGRVRKTAPNGEPTDPYGTAAITFSDLLTGLIMFFVDVYPFQVNHRKLARPYDLFVDGMTRCPPAEFPGSDHALRLISSLSKELRVAQGGVGLLGLPYGGPDLLALRKKHGKAFKALCKWDPDDMSAIFVQDPLDPFQWVRATCMWPDYAENLSWNQHKVIRAFQRRELKAKDSEKTLWEARMRLHDHWLGATGKRKRGDAILAARFAGLTSSRIAPPPTRTPPAKSDAAQAAIPVPAVASQLIVPQFDSFDLGGA